MKNGGLLFFLLLVFFSCSEKQQVGEASQINIVSKDKMFIKMDENITNIKFKNLLPENTNMHGMAYEYYYNGGGVALADLDNDGLPELFFTGNRVHNKLYKNLGNFRFEDITDEAGVTDSPSWTTGVSLVDINYDGILDIYISRSGMLDTKMRLNVFFVSTAVENGIPRYVEMAEKLGLADTGYSTQSLFFDYDRDGDLDMFLINHNVEVKSYSDVKSTKSRRDPFVGDRLYRNDGLKFRDVSEQAGIIGNEMGYGLGISAGDLNNDGWPDIYITNDYAEHDYLYFNNGDGTFTESVKKSTGHISNSAMGSDIADYNNDGWLDIVVMDMITEDNYGIKTSMSNIGPERFDFTVNSGLHYQYMVNTLQLNMGNGLFSEAANLGGVTSTNWSWSPLFADYDNDGFKDLFVSNGIKRDFINYDFIYYKMQRLNAAEKGGEQHLNDVVNELIRQTPQRKVSNYIFKNNGDLTFSNRSSEWGLEAISFSNGATYGDLDNDGDLDIVVNNIDDFPFIYQNTIPSEANNYLKIEFDGSVKNRDGIGARIEIMHREQKQIQEQYLTRGYQSAVNKIMHFGLGQDSIVDQLKITWPDGKMQQLADVKTNQVIRLGYENAAFQSKISDDKRHIVFGEYKKIPNFKHQENIYNDYVREGLLPYKLSQLGPGLAVGDVDGDGVEDFYVGGAKGYAGGLFIQQSDGTFMQSSESLFVSEKDFEDINASFFDVDNDGDLDLYVVSGGSEFTSGDQLLRDRLYLNQGSGNFLKATDHLPDIKSSNSCAMPCDFDHDGDIDLFVGGRLIPGKYPFPASSFLLENHQGKFTNITEEKAKGFSNIGMVTDAIWADYNNDGWEDLVVVGEWMPLTFFTNLEGSQFKMDKNATQENTTGWWYSIAKADFDKDGDMDFVAGNLGLNSRYKCSVEEPLKVFADDFDNSGTMDIIFGYYNQGKLFPYKSRNGSVKQMPFLKSKFKDFHSFGLATLPEVYGEDKLENALHYSAKTFATSYIENLGNSEFKISYLDNMAQLSSVKAIIVEDFDLDGNFDLLLAGNSIYTEVETPRIDGSYGLLMKGDGKGSFSSIHPSESNFYLTGDIPDMSIIKIGSEANMNIIAALNDGRLKMLAKSPENIKAH